MALSTILAFIGFTLHVAAVFAALLAGLGLQDVYRTNPQERRATLLFMAACICFTIGGYVLTVMA